MQSFVKSACLLRCWPSVLVFTLRVLEEHFIETVSLLVGTVSSEVCKKPREKTFFHFSFTFLLAILIGITATMGIGGL